MQAQVGQGEESRVVAVGVFAGPAQHCQVNAGPAGVAFDAADGRTRGHPIDYAIVIGYFVAIVAVGTWFGFSRGSAPRPS